MKLVQQTEISVRQTANTTASAGRARPNRLLRGVRWALLACVLLAALAGCRGKTPTPPAATPDAGAVEPIVAQGVAVFEPAAGGTVVLENGAEVTVPKQALSAQATVSLGVAERAPAVPIPRSLLGNAYQFAVEGAEITGVALIKLPLPSDVTADQFGVAPYRWNGTTWERINGRVVGDSIQFGASAPAIYALQGQWSLADATLTLIRPQTPADQLTTPLAVAGQYRYSALPALQDGLVLAHVALKQDTSGGAGRVSGNEALDKTVAEVTLRFKPDPAQARGRIDFSHVFNLKPEDLDLAPGATTRLYASLVVDDAAAPTRRLSIGLEYAQILSIQAVGMELVRPALANEGQSNLRWHVRLDGRTLDTPSALETRLPLSDILARGGLGEYRFVLEVESAGTWTPVSNEVTVQLTLPATATSQVVQAPAPQGTQIAIPIPDSGGTPVAGGAPATPTRRPTPGGSTQGGQASPTPTATPLGQVATATPTRPAWASTFWADQYTLTSGQCTILHWQVDNVIAVYLDGASVTGNQTRQVCPLQTTSYTLRVTTSAGTQDRTVTIAVNATQATVVFTADSYQITSGDCTTLRWSVTDVRAVYLNNEGVAGEASRQVCPNTSTDYELRVESNAGVTTTKRVTITVLEGSAAAIRFWAERYSLPAGGCTTLHWSVTNVREVYLDDVGKSGEGSSQACPAGSQYYTLRVVNNAGESIIRELSLEAGDPGLSAPELIAQGVVSEVVRMADLDSGTLGDQSGYRLTIDGINPLFVGSNGWTASVVYLRVLDGLTQIGVGGPVDWPINTGQQVEFRAVCDSTGCSLQLALSNYLFLRSQ